MAVVEWGIGRLVVATALVAVVGVTDRAPVHAAGSSPQALVLNLRLGGSDGLSGLTKRALQNEVETIWRESHVRVFWVGGKGAAPPRRALTILVTQKAVNQCCPDGSRWPVGQLLRFDGANAIAVASIRGAQRVVDQIERPALVDYPDLPEHQLGIVLGRAVAHEIGHYILRTDTHAEYGLMRANIDVREFADLWTDSFRLDRAAGEHLALLAARGSFVAGEEQDAFSYPTPQVP